jgi:hypothetical protein
LPESAADEHDFWKLGPRRFEHLARALHGAQPGIFGDSLYGPDGQIQFGADHVAHRRTSSGPELEVGQSKAYRRFTPQQVRTAADQFLEHWDVHWSGKNVRRFILFVGCAIKSRAAHDEILTQVARFDELGIEFVVWDANAIYDRLAGAPTVVRGHLDQGWYERLFGPQVGPLTGLQKDLQLGDFGAANVAAYVGQLNLAQSALVDELKRSIRRGESERARMTLEQALFQSAAASASAPETRASMLRLLAGLLIRQEAFERAKALFDEADALDGGSSERGRAILALEAIGPEAALSQTAETTSPEVIEVRTIAYLRLNQVQEALRSLADVPKGPTGAETLRLRALAQLLIGDRANAVSSAREAVSRDSDNRACRQMLAICLFHHALSPVVEPIVGEWPHPVDQPLVRESDDAVRDLTEASELFADLSSQPDLRDRDSMAAWLLGTLACLPRRRSEAQLLLEQLLLGDRFSAPAVAWGMARGLDFDRVAAGRQLDALIAERPDDLEIRLIRIALAVQTRELPLAKRLLKEGMAKPEAAGEQPSFAYWSVVLDLEGGRPLSKEAMATYPWVAFRAALRLRPRKKRLQEIDRLAKDAAAPGGDRRVLLAALQHLLEGGRHNTPADAAHILIEEVDTAEAIAVAAHALYQADRPGEALAALQNVSAFPDSRLPVDLERLRVASLTASGELLEATRESRRIAETTLSPGDLWQSINLQLAVGAVPAAIALYERHADKLADPHPGHIHLAALALHHDRGAAIRITRTLASHVPDELVTGTYGLAAKLNLAAEQDMLVERIQDLGRRGAEGVQMISDIDTVVEMMKKRRAAADEAYEKYQRGHIPIHAMARSNPGALAQLYLGRLVVPEPEGAQPPPLFARYGRRYEQPWPAEASDVVLTADVTALLTAHGSGILDSVERAFRPIRIAPDIQNALAEIRSSLEPAQPSRVEAKRAVLSLLDDCRLSCRSSDLEIDTYKVRWDLEGNDPANTLNLSRLVSLMKIDNRRELGAIRKKLGTTIVEPAIGPAPKAGSQISLDGVMVVTLAEVGALPHLLNSFKLVIEPEEAATLRSEIAADEQAAVVLASLNKLISRLATGIGDGTYSFVPPTSDHDDPLGRSFFQVVSSMKQPGSTLWIDDRFTTAFETPFFRTVTTAEILGALARYERIDGRVRSECRQRLRKAHWLFLDIHAEEITQYLREAVADGDVKATEDLAILRRGAAANDLNRRWFQFPDDEAAKKGARGELPFLLDTGNAAADVLRELWNDESLAIEDAKAASSWLAEYLDPELLSLSVLAPEDPRNDLLVGLHLAQLVMVGIQLLPPKSKRDRLRSYLDWVWETVIDERLRMRPEMQEPFEAALERYLIDLLEDDPSLHRPTWIALAGNLINSLPKAPRLRLLERPKIRGAFGNPDHGNITIDELQFDEVDFWKAAASASVNQAATLSTVTGKQATLRLRPATDRHAASLDLKIGRRTLHLDDWPARVAAPARDIRRTAIAEKADLLDMASDRLDRLAADLARVRPAWKRPMRVMQLAGKTLPSWYADLEGDLRQQKPFKATVLVPQELPPILAYLRLSTDTDQAVGDLIRERGLMVTIQRWSHLPVPPPEALLDEIERATPADINALMNLVTDASRGVWSRMFVAGILWARGQGDEEIRPRLARAVLEIASKEGVAEEWALYSTAAHFFASEFARLDGWSDLTARQQLAVAWVHAGEVAQRLMDATKDLRRTARWLESSRLISPRTLVRERAGYAGDFADPSHVTPARLRLLATGPYLVELVRDPVCGPEAKELLIDHMGERTESGLLPRSDTLQAGLCISDCLGSYLAADLGRMTDEILPGSIIFSRDGLTDLLRSSLEEPADSRAFRVVWSHLLGVTSGFLASSSLSALARRRVYDLDLTSQEDGLRHAREVLQAITRLAGANGWLDLAPAIDAASIALSREAREPEDEDIRSLSTMLEIAFWRARLEDDLDARTAIFARDLERLAAHPRLKTAAEGAAGRFATALAGRHAAPFIDLLAKLRAQR